MLVSNLKLIGFFHTYIMYIVSILKYITQILIVEKLFILKRDSLGTVLRTEPRDAIEAVENVSERFRHVGMDTCQHGGHHVPSAPNFLSSSQGLII